MASQLILMGVIGKPHGVHGQMRVHTYGDDPDRLAEHDLLDAKGRLFALEWARDNVAWISAIADGKKRRITNRDEAASLTNLELFIPRTALPETEEDEFYLADLIGLIARNEAGETIGTVANVLDYGAGASLEIMPGERLIPFNRVCVPQVSVQGGYVVVSPPVEFVVKEAQA